WRVGVVSFGFSPLWRSRRWGRGDGRGCGWRGGGHTGGGIPLRRLRCRRLSRGGVRARGCRRGRRRGGRAGRGGPGGHGAQERRSSECGFPSPRQPRAAARDVLELEDGPLNRPPLAGLDRAVVPVRPPGVAEEGGRGPRGEQERATREGV